MTDAPVPADENPGVYYLRNTFITFLVVGALVAIGGGIGYGTAAANPYGASDELTAVVWVDIGLAMIGFGMLAMLFWFLSIAIDHRQKPAVAPAPEPDLSDSL